MNKMSDTIRLMNGCEIPCIGFGTWQTPEGETAVEAVKTALRAGYRHIDTAAVYGNEISVGRGIRDSGIKREDVFITSKVWNTERGYERTRAAFEKTLKDMELEYLDLYLIHWPASRTQFPDWKDINLSTWQAMTELYKDGRVRAIGVSNFMPHHLEALLKTEVKPMVNQIEFHPGMLQKETVKFCRERGIITEAWSPLGSGRMLEDPTLKEIAVKYGRSTAQLCIRWCLHKGVIPLPKSVTPDRIRENTMVFDFVIAPEDMERIDTMPEFGGSELHPDKIDF